MQIRSWCTPKRAGFLFLFLGAVCAVVAAWLIYPPAGVATAAVAFLVAGYVTLYVEVRRASDRQSAASD